MVFEKLISKTCMYDLTWTELWLHNTDG